MMMLCFALYLRPGESTRLRVQDLVPPVMSRAKRRSPGFWSVVLHPIELSTSSKTGEFDETLLFDLPEIQFIPKALQSVLKLKQKTPNAFIFTKNSANLKTWMEKTGKMVGLDALGPVHPLPTKARRGFHRLCVGPSHPRTGAETRTMEECGFGSEVRKGGAAVSTDVRSSSFLCENSA